MNRCVHPASERASAAPPPRRGTASVRRHEVVAMSVNHDEVSEQQLELFIETLPQQIGVVELDRKAGDAGSISAKHGEQYSAPSMSIFTNNIGRDAVAGVALASMRATSSAHVSPGCPGSRIIELMIGGSTSLEDFQGHCSIDGIDRGVRPARHECLLEGPLVVDPQPDEDVGRVDGSSTDHIPAVSVATKANEIVDHNGPKCRECASQRRSHRVHLRARAIALSAPFHLRVVTQDKGRQHQGNLRAAPPTEQFQEVVAARGRTRPMPCHEPPRVPPRGLHRLKSAWNRASRTAREATASTGRRPRSSAPWTMALGASLRGRGVSGSQPSDAPTKLLRRISPRVRIQTPGALKKTRGDRDHAQARPVRR